eukprot:1140200-Pelagomonas_calceolata.AAC.2
MSLLWVQIVQTSPSMDYLLTKNTLQVVHVNPGFGAYGCSKFLGDRHVIKGCQKLVRQAALLISKAYNV